jgi:site-specific DNA-methyltransferase (adenine-specific)
MSAGSYIELPRNQVLVGDVREKLKLLPSGSIDCVITSPPYFGLRDYGVAGQLGLEPNIEAWVNELRLVCRDLSRVLKPAGSVWLNVGDGYSAHPREGAPVKSLLLGPERLAVALAQDDWIVRNQVIWHKPNAMPHSVRDRLSNSHETIFLLTRNRRYFFDLDAIRVPGQRRDSRSLSRRRYPPAHVMPANRPVNGNGGLARRPMHPLGKNPGDVWPVATAGFRGAHFATFPVELVRRPLLATCPPKVCTGCGQPWRRAVEAIGGRRLATGPLEPACDCQQPARPGVVLDPFMGSGTVALAAEQHGRDWVGIELNPEYATLSQRRLMSRRAADATAPSERFDRPPPSETAA